MKSIPSLSWRRGAPRAAVVLGSLLSLLAAPLPAQTAQDPRPEAASALPGRATERPDPAAVARLASAPALPFRVDPGWPQLPPGYNFGECSGVDVDRAGNVWVFNRGHWPMMEFNRAGRLLQAWTHDTLAVMSSHGVRVGPDGNLWCVDVAGNCVFKVSPQGRILLILGIRQGLAGGNESQDGFDQPTNVAFRANGNLYITDGYVNSRVVEYSPDGYYLGQWGRHGKGDGEFNLVHDAVVDGAGRVYVADRANERVQVFDPDGKFLAKWTGLGAPWGLAYSARENAIYMCDGKYDRICKLGLDGRLLGTLSAFGKAPGKLDYVHDIALDPADGSLYTVEIKNWRVQKWVRTP
jgi:DNA-binding beta-propeller fold protein YncE